MDLEILFAPVEQNAELIPKELCTETPYSNCIIIMIIVVVIITTATKNILICVMSIYHLSFFMHIFSPYMQRLQAAK